MTEACVAATLTPCVPEDVYEALAIVWHRLMADEPGSRASRLVLLAHWALETGFGHGCWCWNLGNIKHVAGDGQSYCMVRLNEVIGGQVRWFVPPDPATWLRAYTSLEDGTQDYLCRMRAEFRAAWPAVMAGDPALFCHLLKLARYYTAPESEYTAGVLRCYHQLDAAIRPDNPTDVALAALAESALRPPAHDTIPADPET